MQAYVLLECVPVYEKDIISRLKKPSEMANAVESIRKNEQIITTETIPVFYGLEESSL